MYCLVGIGANTGGRWNTLHFILANSFTYWGQQCSNYRLFSNNSSKKFSTSSSFGICCKKRHVLRIIHIHIKYDMKLKELSSNISSGKIVNLNALSANQSIKFFWCNFNLAQKQGGSVMCVCTKCSDQAQPRFYLNCPPNEKVIENFQKSLIVKKKLIYPLNKKLYLQPLYKWDNNLLEGRW